MAGNRHNDDRRDDNDDDIVSDREMSADAAKAFRNVGTTFSKSDIGKTKKLFGLFEMDAGIVDAFDSLYNASADFFNRRLQPKVFSIVTKYAPSVGLGKYGTSLGSFATIGTAFAIKVGPYFGSIIEGLRTQKKELNKFARESAQVLDDLKGNHSLIALYSVKQDDNDVIYAHRVRLNRIANTTNLSNFIDVGIKSGGSLAWDLKAMGSIAKGHNEMTPERLNEILHPPKAPATAEKPAEGAEVLQTIKTGTIAMLPQIASRIALTKQYQLRTELQPYSAYQMIQELGEQISSNPKARGFAMPKSFQSSKGKREEYPLEEYLMRICIQHQKEMADAKPEHTEIREALREDLAAAVQPIAHALRKGDLNTTSLIHLIGEHKLIKKEGRTIATPEEVEELLGHKATKHANDNAAKPTVEKPEYHGKIKGEDRKKAANDEEDKQESHSHRESRRRHGEQVAYRD